ncbi:MAG: hypothetical protein EAZ85_12205 [Bacteroidetes bacterium]|nr:MAG: hypothetical protein EAZ85_12205 [Bacteroidota bacterium]TAG92561.1 MAG: hypothetical protein EAZ20_02425 [Bacteroidota bacterium]
MANSKNKKIKEEIPTKKIKTPYFVLKQEALKAQIEKEKVIERYKPIKIPQKDVLKNNIFELIELFAKKESDYQGHLIDVELAKIKESQQTFIFNKIITFIKELIAKKAGDILIRTEYCIAIIRMVENESKMINNIKNWKSKTHNVDKKFESLITFLFVKYKMPTFLYNVWQANIQKEINWFIHLAGGGSVRALEDLPINLTQKMAFFFMQAPAYMDIKGALRYAQVMSFGGDEHLAWFINQSLLGRNNFQDEVFWEKVIHFFAQAGMFNAEKISEIVDYLIRQYRDNPNFSMKGRTISALLRQSDEWHLVFQKELKEKNAPQTWEKSFVNDFEKEEGSFEKNNYKQYFISELLSAKQLREEGQKMMHCVGGYVSQCVKRRTAIFTFEMGTFGGLNHEKLITIEIDLIQRKLVQAKGKHNRNTNSNERRIIELWLNANFLKKSTWVNW